MPQIRTLLRADQRRDFGRLLLQLAERLIAEAPSVHARRSVRGRIIDALKQPSISRLREYETGDYFPTANVVRSLANALNSNAFFLLRAAGYDREVVRDLHDLWLKARRQHDESAIRLLLTYAISIFPRRGERYRTARNAYLDAFDEIFVSMLELDPGKDRRVLRQPLSQAYTILGNDELDVTCRRAICAELVRSWTYGVNEPLSREIELEAYLRIPGIGEEALPGIPPPPLFSNLLPKNGGKS